MKALQKTAPGPGNLELVDVPEPVCGSHDVKIRISRAGICGTDLHIQDGSFPCVTPLVPGHEFAGSIVEAGKAVTRFAPGDRVAAIGSAAVTCGYCRYCWAGQYCFCPERKGMGHTYQGAFAEYVVLPERVVLPLPDHLTYERAALAEPLACVTHAILERGRITSTDSILILGPGAIGLLALATLVKSGCSVVIAGVAGDEDRLRVARTLGAVETAASTHDGIAQATRAAFGAAEVDVVVECAGHPNSIATAATMVRKDGQVLQVGLPLESFEYDYGIILRKGLSVIGSYGHCHSSWIKALALLSSPAFPADAMLGKTWALDAWQEAFQSARSREAVRVLLEP